MKLWPFGRTEHRQSYSDLVVSQIVGRASGEVGSNKVGAYEAAAGLWSRAFAVAEVSPEGYAYDALTPFTLASMGRALCTGGEWCAEVGVGPTGAYLDQASTWTIAGEGPPETWTYTLSFDRPSATVQRVVPADRVVHVRLPGCSPLVGAADTVAILSRLDGSLSREMNAAVGYLVPVGPGQKDELAGDIISLKGRVGVVETTKGHSDRNSGPDKDFDSVRIGPSPPEVLIKLRESAERSVYAAAGVPPLSSNQDGTSQRESMRRFLHSTLGPVGVIAASELADKLATPGLTFSFKKLYAADTAGRSRSVGILVGAGVSLEQALTDTGFSE